MELAERMGLHFASEKENYEIIKREYENALAVVTQKCVRIIMELFIVYYSLK